MAIERYVNFSAATELTATYTAGDTHIDVTSTAAPFPNSGLFSLVLVDVTTGAEIVLLTVTAVTSGTRWATTPEGGDATAASGSKIYAVLTARSLDQIRADCNQIGPYSSLPSTPHKGDTYRCTDIAMELVYNGSVWVPFYDGFPISTPPSQSTFTTLSGTVTKTDDKGTMKLVYAGSATLLTAAPATPYTIEMGIERSVLVKSGGNNGIGALFSGGATTSDKLTIFIINGDLLIQYQPNLSTFGRFVYAIKTGAGQSFGTKVWIRLKDDGTNRSYSVSANGIDWSVITSEGHTTDYTPAYVGIQGYSGVDGNEMVARLFHWKVSS